VRKIIVRGFVNANPQQLPLSFSVLEFLHMSLSSLKYWGLHHKTF